MQSRVSLRAFGRDRGVSHQAVRKAVASGRIKVAYDLNGRPFIANLVRAREQWAAARGKPAPKPKEARTLAEAQRMVAHERVVALRLENDARRGRLLPRDEVERVWTAGVAAARTTALAWKAALVPTLARAFILEGEPGLDRVLDDAVRQFLTELARGGDVVVKGRREHDHDEADAGVLGS